MFAEKKEVAASTNNKMNKKAMPHKRKVCGQKFFECFYQLNENYELACAAPTVWGSVSHTVMSNGSGNICKALQACI